GIASVVVQQRKGVSSGAMGLVPQPSPPDSPRGRAVAPGEERGEPPRRARLGGSMSKNSVRGNLSLSLPPSLPKKKREFGLVTGGSVHMCPDFKTKAPRASTAPFRMLY